jgi:hypothetical protein
MEGAHVGDVTSTRVEYRSMPRGAAINNLRDYHTLLIVQIPSKTASLAVSSDILGKPNSLVLHSPKRHVANPILPLSKLDI